MSKNFVLVQYGNQTRKIQGDPTRKKYNTLVRQIQDKFDIDHEVNIQVYDRVNQQYFAIDKNEIREIQNGGKIKVTRKGNKKSQGGGKKKGSPLKPPGVPPPTEEDDAKRVAWRKNTKVEIYSETALKWMPGQIQQIYNDNEGEWLVIRYTKAKGGVSTKEIQRFSNYIRPVQERKRKKKETQNGDRKKQKESPKKERKEPRQPKPVKVTTQSKYRKVKAPLSKEDGPENVVEFKGNGRIKQFIDRTCILLRGPREAPHEEVKSADDDEKVDESQPSKKWDVVHLTGVGRAMSSVVAAAEIVKRIVPGLHQETKMEVKEMVDVYEPTEAGLKNVEVSRSMTAIRVTLSVTGQEVNSSAAGYQAPEQYEDGFGAIEYEYPDEKKARRAARNSRRKKQAAKN